MENIFGKEFRIAGLDGRKCWKVVVQRKRFASEYLGLLQMVFCFFCSLLDYIVLVCFLKISSPSTSKMIKLSFVVKTEEVTISDKGSGSALAVKGDLGANRLKEL